MSWPDVLLALVRCELKARFNGFRWQVTARGALPVIVLATAIVVVWAR